MKDEMLKDMLDSVTEGRVFRGQGTGHLVLEPQCRAHQRLFPAAEVLGSRCSDNILRHVDEAGRELCGDGCPLVKVMTEEYRYQGRGLPPPQGRASRPPCRCGPFPTMTTRTSSSEQSRSSRTGRSAWRSSRSSRSSGARALPTPLTGLGNRRYIDIRLESLVDAFSREGRGFGFLMLDIDHFKKVNDTYGHAAGDRGPQDGGLVPLPTPCAVVMWQLAGAGRSSLSSRPAPRRRY